MNRRAAIVAALALTSPALAHDAGHDARLPVIGPAPEFALVSQDEAAVTLGHFAGKTVALTFIYTACLDTCPLLTDKMARIQDSLGADFGEAIAFVSISVDPRNDTPAVLKAYAEAHGADPRGWTFLTGEAAAIREVQRRYGVFAAAAADGGIDHTFLTSLIDSRGDLRVQYLGVRFDPEEFRRDLVSLVAESR